MSDRTGRPRPVQGIAAREIGGEAVLIDTRENVVRLLNHSASRIWALANGERTEREIAAQLALEFEVGAQEAEGSVRRFVDEMVAKKLLEWG